MVVNGTKRPPGRSLFRSLLGGRADIGLNSQNGEVDPERHFDALDYRTAKRLIDHLVGE